MAVSKLTVPSDFGLGEWCDVDYNPKIRMAMLATIARPGRLMLFLVSEPCEPEAFIDLGRWGLYLRLGIDDAGRSAMILQDGRDGPPFHPAIVVIHAEGGIREVPCPVVAFGQNGVEVVGLENGWFVWVLVDPVTIWRAKLSWDGAWSEERRFTVPETSQGFTDGSRDGTIRMLDAWRFAFAGMVCPSEDNHLAIGQNAFGPDRLVGHQEDTAGLFTVYSGPAFEPHVVSIADGRWLGCARTAAGPAVIALQAPFQLEGSAPPPPPPPPDPHPDPPPQENPPMDMPDAVDQEIRRFVDQRPPNWTMHNGADKDDYFRTYTGELASHLAFKFGPRWGTKRASSGRPNTKDAIAYQDTRILYGFDIFHGVGTDNTGLDINRRGVNLTDPLPENQMTGDQVFVAPPAFGTPAPKDWLGGGTPVPVPDPPPDPDPGPVPGDDVVTRLARIEAKLDGIISGRTPIARVGR